MHRAVGYCPVPNQKPGVTKGSTDSRQANQPTVRGMKPRHSELSHTGRDSLPEKYWQCGDKSHDNKEMHTLFNSTFTYKKLFSTSL